MTAFGRWSRRSDTVPRSIKRVRRHASGFTLLEVLVALAILSVAVVASIQGFAQGLRLLKVSGDHQLATQLADEKARDVPVPMKEGREEGTEGRFQWERVTRVVAAPELAANGPAKWRVFEVDVTVKWDQRRQVQIATLRTTPIDETVQVPGRTSTPGTTVTPAPTTVPPALRRVPGTPR